jgi:hypothetical protein
MKASNLLKLDSKILDAVNIKSFDLEKIKSEAMRYDAMNALKTALQSKSIAPENQPELSKKLSAIDINTPMYNMVIVQLAKQQQIDTSAGIKIIETYQKHYRLNLLDNLMKQSPTLDAYVKLIREQQKAMSNFDIQITNKKMFSLAREIANNKSLHAQIKQYLPKLRDNLSASIKRGLDRERGIGR